MKKLRKLTPNQSYIKNYNHSKFKNVKNFKVLKETRILHQKRKDLSKLQIIEFSILFLILNYIDIASEKFEEFKRFKIFISKKPRFKKYYNFIYFRYLMKPKCN